jgi:tryptophan halogenase
VHYKYNTHLDTPFWQHCRQATDLAGAEQILEYYAENGPSGFWGPTLLNNPHDQFTFSGYATLLTGMRVPYRKTWEGALPDASAFEQRRTLYKQLALQGFTVREALAAIRSPQWKWN